MATRSVVGEIAEDGTFRGRYVHWDGSPSTRGPVLANALAMFDGSLEHLIIELIEKHTGWSTLVAREGVLGQPYEDEPDEWWTGKVGRHGDVEEWGFFFTSREAIEAELVIVQGGRKPVEVGRVKVTELHKLGEQAWYDIECGKDLSRCKHMAWVHFPDLGTGCRLSTRKYLGTEPLDHHDATGAVYQGTTYIFTGVSWSGGYGPRWPGRDGWYYSEGQDPYGHRTPIPVQTKGGKVPASTTLIFPEVPSHTD